MFTDPQTVTIATVANSLLRVGAGESDGWFKSADGNVGLEIHHYRGRRNRDVLKLTHRKVAADPLLAGVNVEAGMSAVLTVDTPKTGYTVSQAKEVVDALVAYLAASTGARVTQLLGQEI